MSVRLKEFGNKFFINLATLDCRRCAFYIFASGKIFFIALLVILPYFLKHNIKLAKIKNHNIRQ